MVAPGGFGGDGDDADTTRAVFAVIDIKSRVVGIDTDNPRKELSQRFDKIKLKTQIINEEEYAIRLEIAEYVLAHGYDIFFL